MERVPPRADLRFSKILSGRVGARVIRRPMTWIDLLVLVHQVRFDILVKRTGSVEESRDRLIRVSPANLVAGEATAKGFAYVPAIRSSIQRQEAQDTWRHCAKLCFLVQQVEPDFDIELTIRWAADPAAAFPGQSRLLRPDRIEDIDFG